MTTDTTEKGFESLIMRHMTGSDGLFSCTTTTVAEAEPSKAGSGWFAGSPAAYDREFCVDTEQLFAFLQKTQPEEYAKLGTSGFTDKKSMARQKFLARLQGEIARRGVIDVLRHGIKHEALSFDLFYGTPSPENAKAVARHGMNRFSITRQLRYSREETKRALDLCALINGLPVITFELKNSLTKQTVADAIEQYKRDRNAREPLFHFGGLFADPKRMEDRILSEIPKKVSADTAYQNAKKNSDRQNARIEHDKALKRVITALFADDAQLFKQFQDNESFRRWLTDTVFGRTYEE